MNLFLKHPTSKPPKIFIALFASMLSSQILMAQKSEFNPVETGVTSLSIAPDARGASMGDLGAATDPDANSQFWNPSKYAFAYSKAEVALNYTPWLRSLVNDIFLADVSGYYKWGKEENQAVSASLRYFSLGEVQASSLPGDAIATYNPYEFSFDLGYSRLLSQKYSMGIVLRYIYSALGFSQYSAGVQQAGASAFSADVSGYFTTYPIVGRSECQFSWGWNISNIGTKVSFFDGADQAFLPTNLKLGAVFKFPLAQYHNLAIGVDLNKLLVPTRPREADFDMNTQEGQKDYDSALQEWKDMSPITGIFKSFSDAPGGFKEEIREISVSLGAEYSYNEQFFARAGYFYENEFKGNRKYFSMGAGFALDMLRLDVAYMLATVQTSPLNQTLRFSLTFNIDGIRDLFGRKK